MDILSFLVGVFAATAVFALVWRSLRVFRKRGPERPTDLDKSYETRQAVGPRYPYLSVSKPQKIKHLAKRKELWGARADGGRSPPTQRKGFAAETEGVTGTSKRRIDGAIAQAEKVPEYIRDEIRGTDLDKGVVLDDIARTPPENQHDRPVEWKSGRQSKIDAYIKYRAPQAAAEKIAVLKNH